MLKSIELHHEKGQVLRIFFTLYLDSGRRKTMSQLFFCLLSKTKAQPVLAGCRARFRSLHYNAPKPVLVQNCPSSAPECLSSAHSLHGQDLRRDNLLHVPPRDQPPGCAHESPGTHRWTPGCISEMQNSQRVEQDRTGRGRRKQKVQEPLVRSVRTEFLPQGCLSCILCAGQEPWEVTLCPKPGTHRGSALSTWGITVPEWHRCYTYTRRGKKQQNN